MESLNVAVWAVPALLAVLVVIYQARALARLCRTVAQQEKVLADIGDDVRALFDSSVGLGERLKKAENAVRVVQERQDHLDLKEPSYQSYAHAIRRVKKGAGVEELMSDCDLTRGEAELIALLYKMDGTENFSSENLD